MTSTAEDHHLVRRLCDALQQATSLHGQGIEPTSDFEENFQSVIRSHSPSSLVLSMAGSIQARRLFDSHWAAAVIRALDDQFHINLNSDLIKTQVDLAKSNDELGLKMYVVAVVGVILSLVGLAVTLAPFFVKK